MYTLASNLTSHYVAIVSFLTSSLVQFISWSFLLKLTANVSKAMYKSRWRAFYQCFSHCVNASELHAQYYSVYIHGFCKIMKDKCSRIVRDSCPLSDCTFRCLSWIVTHSSWQRVFEYNVSSTILMFAKYFLNFIVWNIHDPLNNQGELQLYIWTDFCNILGVFFREMMLKLFINVSWEIQYLT